MSAAKVVHARIQKVLSEGVQFFLVDEGREDPNTTKSGPSSAHQQNANGVSLAGRWWPNIECCHGSFVTFHGIQTSFDKEPYSFVFFQGRIFTL